MNTSTPNVSAFVHDLVAMAKATEQVPVLERDLAYTQRQLEDQSKAVQDREVAIQLYKQELADLRAKLQSVEAERDDAELRFLEAEDKAHKVLDLVRGVQSALGQTVVTLDPPKPEPVVSHEQTQPSEGSSETSPTGSAMAPSGQEYSPQGQSEDAPQGFTSPPTPEHHTELPPAPEYVTPNPTTLPETGVTTGGGGTGGSEITQADISPVGQSEGFPTSASSSPGYSSSGPVESALSSGWQPEEVAGPYSNEPNKDSEEWITWSYAMDAKYGPGNWPVRPV